MQVKLQKVTELSDALHPNNIEVGFERVGEFIKAPEVGDVFYVDWYWRTSTIQEILDDSHFRTYNSIYKWEIINQDFVEDKE